MTMHWLYDSVSRRKRPEDVADRVLRVLDGDLGMHERRLLEKAARGSLRRKAHGYTSMLEDFVRPIGLDRQVARARLFFETDHELDADGCSSPTAVTALLEALNAEIFKTFGRSDFMCDRLNREVRQSVGLEISRRQYNKRFRLLGRMERKVRTLARETQKYELTRVGKTGLATRLGWEAFSADRNTACFIAYYAARANLRSEFTVAGQQKAYDTIAEALLKRCERSETTNWLAIAHVYPTPRVLSHLSDAEKGELLGVWFGLLQEIGTLLRTLDRENEIDRERMIVRRGNDSTTWNNTASAWNRAREAWIALLYAMGAESLLERLCPGKVLRLMAADVAAWHRAVGHDVDPDTRVWAELPLPWQVLSGTRRLGRAEIEHVCRIYGVDPVARGWTAPKPVGKAAAFRPTPELVHGVTVASPQLASILKGAGWFSGKSSKPIATQAGKLGAIVDELTHAALIGAHCSEKERELADQRQDETTSISTQPERER